MSEESIQEMEADKDYFQLLIQILSHSMNMNKQRVLLQFSNITRTDGLILKIQQKKVKGVGKKVKVPNFNFLNRSYYNEKEAIV